MKQAALASGGLQYQAPTSIGNNIASGIVEIDGDLYQFPIPVSAFVRNSWQMGSSCTPDVPFGSDGGYELVRNGRRLDGMAYNTGKSSALLSNCVIEDMYSAYAAIILFIMVSKESNKIDEINIQSTRRQ